ncbi:hypothetical protein [Flavobacterium selenitireducens]|uniref:hypothetical protein n=1 Tax=Flavobacterium selenitireducens TaxID=2722704 RepID=UPI00168BA6EA|nr:hypothetical protein [Flavobacterium selenitireducens]MBD3584083.1 hypothetical protein [Flavobacterium selenitireducens]
MKYKCTLLALPLFFAGCIGWNNVDDSVPNSRNYEPQIMEREIFESSVQLMPAQNVQKSGKIYIQGNLLVVNDVNRGFHIYNYANPSQPQPLAFLNIPGATDVAIRESTIYINQAVDLVTVQYDADNNTLSLKDRNRNVFPQKMAPDASYAALEENEIIINWTPID